MVSPTAKQYLLTINELIITFDFGTDQERKPKTSSNDSETNAENSPDGGGAKKRGGLIDRLLETIINNVQIRIRNVHARYEDEILCPGVCRDACVCVCVRV